MSKNLTYEYFVKGAFSMNFDTHIERGEDPASVADADIFAASNSQEYLNKAKVGVAYAIAAYNHEIFKTKSIKDDDYNLMQNLLERALCANDSLELFDVIERYTVIRDKYFKFRWQQ